MDSIKALFEELEELTLELSKRATEPDEFVACSNLNKAVDKAEETFKRTKNIDKADKEP